LGFSIPGLVAPDVFFRRKEVTTVTISDVDRLLEQYETLNARADRVIDRYIHDLIVRDSLHNLAGVRRLEIDAHTRGAYSYDGALRVLRARLGEVSA
jgi:hypothetical protein